MKRVGVVVNPIAGMGGRIGLKGTDGKVEEARSRGAEPRAPGRARDALEALYDVAPETKVIAAGGQMGAEIAREAGFEPRVVSDPPSGIGETSGMDTREAVLAFLERDADLVLFVGGDGTAVDVAEVVQAEAPETPLLGVPAGVKIYSGVFGVTPRAAGEIAGSFERTEKAEVNDVDEAAYREGEVNTELRAVVSVPVAEQRQSSKQLGGGSVAGLAEGVADELRPGVTYCFGPGSTVGAIAEAAGFDASPLGVDAWRDGEIVVRDGGADDLRAALGDENVIMVSPIGGQGFVFGRGNQQFAPDIIRESDVEIVASRRKLDAVGVLRVDTGDEEVDESLRGWAKVRVGRVERRLVEVV